MKACHTNISKCRNTCENKISVFTLSGNLYLVTRWIMFALTLHNKLEKVPFRESVDDVYFSVVGTYRLEDERVLLLHQLQLLVQVLVLLTLALALRDERGQLRSQLLQILTLLGYTLHKLMKGRDC